MTNLRVLHTGTYFLSGILLIMLITCSITPSGTEESPHSGTVSDTVIIDAQMTDTDFVNLILNVDSTVPKTLIVRNKKISDLSLLGRLRSLEKVEIVDWANNSNFNWLSNLPDLRVLKAHSSLKDLSPIKNCTNLEFLDISWSTVTDLNCLINNTSLKTLYANNCNYLKNIDAISNMKQLDTLKIFSSAITTLEPLTGIASLKYLDVGDCRDIDNIEPIGTLVNLQYLDLDQVKSVSIDCLRNCTKLETVFLSNAGLTDIGPLANLHSLEKLYLVSNKNLSDIDPIASLTSIKLLYLAYCKISDISALQPLHALTYVDLRGNPLNDVSPLKDHKFLSTLDLEGCENIADLSGLSGLNDLNRITLSNCPVMDLTPLTDCGNLCFLYLDNTKIDNCNFLSLFPRLIVLSIVNTTVSDIRPLSTLTKLNYLRIYGCNNITDYTPLLSCLENTDELISNELPQEIKASLDAKGVKVTITK